MFGNICFINSRYMSICDTPTTTETLDVKPQIAVPTQTLKSAVTSSAGPVVGPDVKPLISKLFTFPFGRYHQSTFVTLDDIALLTTRFPSFLFARTF